MSLATPYVNCIKFTSVLLLGCGIGALALGFETFLYKGLHAYGGWYGGTSSIISALYCMTFSDKTRASRYFVSLSFTILLTFIASIVDGVAFGFINSLQACTGNTFNTYGNSEYFLASAACELAYMPDCSCVTQSQVNGATCYEFNASGISNGDCDPILTEYPNLIYSAYCVDMLCLFLAIALVTVMCQAARYQEVMSSDILIVNNPYPSDSTAVYVVTANPPNNSTYIAPAYAINANQGAPTYYPQQPVPIVSYPTNSGPTTVIPVTTANATGNNNQSL